MPHSYFTSLSLKRDEINQDVFSLAMLHHLINLNERM